LVFSNVKFLLIFAALPLLAADPKMLARDILRELVEINTTDSIGDNTKAAEAVAARLKTAGYTDSDIQILGAPRKGNLVARLHGTGSGKPILFLAHLDVVEARREDWSFDPFIFREQDGYFYGRGTEDNKAGDATLVANFIRLKQEGFRPPRDFILALTSDEEGGSHNGVEWLLANHRPLIEAEYCLNTDVGGGVLRQGKPVLHGIQASEKLFFTVRLEVKSPGGHSSVPEADNAIYRLAQALDRLSKFEFPIHPNEVTRAYFERMLNVKLDVVSAPGLAAKSPFYNALLRTTCVATMLQAGHAENALPQTARATVNCRILPGETTAETEATLRRVISDDRVSITPVTQHPDSPASPLLPSLIDTIGTLTSEMWPGVPVVPSMSTGASDSRQLRTAGIPAYGVSAIFEDENENRAHGRDERVPVKSFYDAVEFYYRLMKRLN
jgi:acetylornithine deacetylase/succinyl-diaminopimelate desuccinylase-like protein